MFKRLVDGVEVLVAAVTVWTVVMMLTLAPVLPTGAEPDLGQGGEIFRASCATCHGSEGGGGAAPALAGEGALAGFESADQLFRFVSTGVPGRMPGFETRLHPDEIEAVTRFVWEELGGRE